MNLSASPGRPACPSRASGWSSCPRLGVSRVAYAFLVYMLSPLPRRSGWTYCFAHSLQPYQPSPKGSSGRPAHRPFRGLLGVHSRYGLHTRAVTVYRDTLTRGFSHFVTSMTAPVASGWSDCRVGLTPTGKRRLFTAHTRIGQQVGEHIKRKLDVFERYWSASLTRHIACAPDCQRFSDLPVQGIVRLNTISQERR
jgi:hypothetical protein